MGPEIFFSIVIQDKSLFFFIWDVLLVTLFPEHSASLNIFLLSFLLGALSNQLPLKSFTLDIASHYIPSLQQERNLFAIF